MGAATTAEKVRYRGNRVRLSIGNRSRAIQCRRALGSKGRSLESLIPENALMYDMVALAEEVCLVRRIREE
jgi:hypothetical protein